MNEHPIKSLIDASMAQIKEMVDGDTVIGEPIKMGEDCIIIPVSQVAIGFASGGSDLPVKAQPKDFFGGGSGAGLKVTPVGFLVVNKGEVKLLQFNKKSDTTADRAVGMIPDMVDKVTGFVTNMRTTKAEPAVQPAETPAE